MTTARGAAFWEKVVREVEAGATQAEVARRYGISRTWMSKQVHRFRSGAEPASLLPVRVFDGPTRRIELVTVAGRLSFEEGTDPSYIAALAQRLSA